MAENSAIEWCDHTFNGWEGCQKVGPGCDHCYAEVRDVRFTGGKHWGPGAPRRRTSPANWRKPLRWNRHAEAYRAQHGHWPRVFCSSLSDVFDNAVDPAWRKDLWELIRATPNLRWILLTKRGRNIVGMLPFGWLEGDFDHVGVMITVVDQAEADRDVPKLLDVPMAGRQWRGISHEPALGGIRWSGTSKDGKRQWNWLTGETGIMHPDGPDFDQGPKLDWIIWGGESGPKARPAHPDWARADRDQCAAVGTAFLMKQWGEYLPVGQTLPGYGRVHGATAIKPGRMKLHYGGTGEHAPQHAFAESGVEFSSTADGLLSFRVGKTNAGRLLDGLIHHEFPAALS